ncbi:methyltransferase domain-containing protein [Georgenia subflava]|uniref:methyltransferase domain-containing protein n=1 Tax=Georgenia subflava TaxID=1622177 RepID=UPI00186B4ADC|nr:methyltransferase domain-containing protein [Georgenia subflava]
MPFSEANARRDAARYRRRGLDRVSAAIVDQVVARGVEGRTVLEIGAGVGVLSVELLRRGAGSATCLELATTYEREAAALAGEAGVSDRIVRRRADIVADPAAVAPADVVVLNRVVCCYPDDVALLEAAASHARELVVLSFPRPDGLTRAIVAVSNAVVALSGTSFRGYVHPWTRMLDTLQRCGSAVRLVRRGLVWHVAVGVRPG